MRAGLRHSGSRTPGWLAGALRSGGTGRHAPGRGPVGRTGWRNARGRPCLPAAAKAPRVLAGRLGLELPPPRDVPDPAAAPAVPDADVPGTAVARRREDPGPVPPGPVGGAAGRRLWEAMVERRHPLGRARPPGARVRQWIRPERHGVPGGTGFGSAAWRLAARDAWTGWPPGARAASTGRVVRSHRFLPLPGVRVYGLAPEVLRMAAARVADGREARYPGPSRGVLHPRRPGALRIPPSPRGLDRRRARRRAQGRGRHGARPGAGEGWRGAPRQAERRPVGTPGAGPGDGDDGPGDPAGARPRRRQRDALHAGLAARAPALDRERPRGSPPEGREHAHPPRCPVELPGGTVPPPGGLRPQPGREEGQGADRVRAALRRRRLPGGGGGLPGERVRPFHRPRPGPQGPQALRRRARGAGGRQGHDHHGAHPRGPGAGGARPDIGAQDRGHPQAAQGGRGRRAGPARPRGAGSRRGGGGHGPGPARRTADGLPEPEAAGRSGPAGAGTC